jgi:outer membrane lipoprotein-sorting protein
MLIVADGHALTMLDTELNQMQRWPSGNSPLGALLDPARDVTRYGTVLPGFEAGTLGVEVRDRTHPEYGEITLIFLRKPSAPGGLELAAWISQDAQNRRTTVRLTNHRYGVPAGDELFRLLNPQARPHH